MEPGQRYQLQEPLRFKVSERTPWPMGVRGSFGVWPEDSSAAAAARKATAGKRDGKRVALVARGPVPRSAGDADPSDNVGRMWIQTSRNPADLSAKSVTVTGGVGDTVALSVTATNNGPADTDTPADGSSGSFRLTAPSGTVFSKVDDMDCAPYVNGKVDWTKHGQGGHRSYFCMFHDGRVEAGESTSHQLTLTIKSRQVGSDGSIEVNAGGVPDDNPKNNKAALVVQVKGSGTPGSPSASASGGGGSGDGGPLPTTGVSLPVYGAVGALLIAVGGGLYLLGRRRRSATAAAGAESD